MSSTTTRKRQHPSSSSYLQEATDLELSDPVQAYSRKTRRLSPAQTTNPLANNHAPGTESVIEAPDSPTPPSTPSSILSESSSSAASEGEGEGEGEAEDAIPEVPLKVRIAAFLPQLLVANSRLEGVNADSGFELSVEEEGEDEEDDNGADGDSDARRRTDEVEDIGGMLETLEPKKRRREALVSEVGADAATGDTAAEHGAEQDEGSEPDVEGASPYIEMRLGLGVLEQQQQSQAEPGAKVSLPWSNDVASSNSSDGDDDAHEDADADADACGKDSSKPALESLMHVNKRMKRKKETTSAAAKDEPGIIEVS